MKVKLASFLVIEWKQFHLERELKIAPNTCFESLSFVPFSTKERLINNENDPDVNLYIGVFTLDIQCLAPEKFQRNLEPFSKQLLSILHLNIRSIKKILKPLNLNRFTCLLISILELFVFQKRGLMIQTFF